MCRPLGRLGQPGVGTGWSERAIRWDSQAWRPSSAHTPDVSSQAVAKVADAYAALRRCRDPKRRLLLATQLLASLTALERLVSEVRDDAVLALRATGASYADIAKLAGVNRSRVAQLAQRTTTARSRIGKG